MASEVEHPAEHRALAVLLVAGGIGHFLVPRAYDSIVPRALPGGRRFWTLAGGLAEVATGLAVATPSTRRAGGLAAAAVFAGVFPANVHMAWQWRHRPWPYRLGALARLPLQAPLVAWGLRVASAAPRR